MGSSFLCADRARSPPVKVLSSQLGRAEYVKQRCLAVSVVWMQGTVLEVQADHNTVLNLDETGVVPKFAPCKYVMVMGVIQSHSPEPMPRAVKMADLSENALIHRKSWI
uniref:RecQ mediated genome instability 2 n=1 Tax=Sinocyclocheilus grahami TaxID=75366 RepID=A0A672MLP9_SINGR